MSIPVARLIQVLKLPGTIKRKLASQYKNQVVNRLQDVPFAIADQFVSIINQTRMVFPK
jgi:hypothetical protein